MQNSQKDLYKKLLGRTGEKLAEKYLKKIGYTILKTNYKTPFGEIDIIAKDGDTVVFVEVKTRTDDFYGSPAEAVNAEKRRKYGMVANSYLVRYNLTDAVCRFDAVEVINKEINHIIDAFSM